MPLIERPHITFALKAHACISDEPSYQTTANIVEKAIFRRTTAGVKQTEEMSWLCDKYNK